MPVCLSQHGFVQLLQHLKRYICPRSLGSDHVSEDLRVARARALGQRVDRPSRPRTAGTHQPGPGFRGVRCAQSWRAWYRLFNLLLWHTHGFSLLFSGKTVLFQGACCGRRGPGVGVGGSGCCAGMKPFILTSSCGNGSRGSLWPCCLQWLPLHRGLVASAFCQALRGLGFALVA